MKCPFLQETEVCSCQMASVRKQIPRTARVVELGRCSSPRFVECPLYLERHTDSIPSDPGRCEFLETSLVQFCGAAPLPRYVPYSESPAARCVTDAYRYCDEYLSLAHAGHELGDRSIENIDMPGRLFYSRNHMWLDRADDGGCHVGIDAFLAKTLRQTDGVAFVTSSGTHNPTAVLTAHGVDFQVVFPAALIIVRPNVYLRSDPARITTDPYRSGWLFEARELPGQHVEEGLLSGAEANAWMRRDIERLSSLAHEQVAKRHPELALDGGCFGEDLLDHLSREEKLSLFQEYFSPYAGSKE